MLGFALIGLFVFILTVMMVVILTEGIKITTASTIGFFSLGWAYVVDIWGSFTEFVYEPAVATIMGERVIDVFGIGAVILLFSWFMIIVIAVTNIILTSSRKGANIRIFQDITEDKSDGL